MKRNVIDQVIGPMRRLAISDVELVALKAIMCLDPNTAKIDARSATLLSVARDSVQNALYGHLSSSLPPTEATSRFGNILLLVASISVCFSMCFIIFPSRFCCEICNMTSERLELRIIT